MGSGGRGDPARRCAFAGLGIEIEVRNQGRVHIWYQEKFGTPYPALSKATDGIDRFLCDCAMVACGRRRAAGTMSTRERPYRHRGYDRAPEPDAEFPSRPLPGEGGTLESGCAADYDHRS